MSPLTKGFCVQTKGLGLVEGFGVRLVVPLVLIGKGAAGKVWW